jgi:hypothetical protein
LHSASGHPGVPLAECVGDVSSFRHERDAISGRSDVLVGGVPNRTVIQWVVLRGSFALAGDDMEGEQVARCARP